MTHPPVMSLRGITHSFGAVRALIDVDRARRDRRRG